MAIYVVKTASDFIPPCGFRETEVEASDAQAAREAVKKGIIVSVTKKS